MVPDLDQYVSGDEDVAELASRIVKFAIAIHSKAVVEFNPEFRELSEPIWAWARAIERICVKAG